MSPGPGILTPTFLAPAVLRAAAEEWLVAATIATEVPPRPTDAFPAAAIPLAVRAVAEVIANRRVDARFPGTALEVVLQIKQFSGVLRGVTLAQAGHRDFWLEAVAGRWFPDHVSRCLAEWRRLERSPAAPRVVPGALWYYSPVSMIPPGRVPSWAADHHPVPLAGVPTDWFTFLRP